MNFRLRDLAFTPEFTILHKHKLPQVASTNFAARQVDGGFLAEIVKGRFTEHLSTVGTISFGVGEASVTWVVQLLGDTSDLAALSQSLTDSDINVSHDGQDYILTSDDFGSGEPAEAIRQKAEKLVGLLNGASRLALDAIQSIRVGAVYRRREDGTREIHVVAEPIVIRFRSVAPTVRLAHADGTIEDFHPADPIKGWAALAQKNSAIADVFRVIATGTLDWVNLYRILEIVGSDVGDLDVIAANGWATKASINLFKHTANSPGALGLDARHGAQTNQPPKHPMGISEARALISSIIHAWLRSKAIGP